MCEPRGYGRDKSNYIYIYISVGDFATQKESIYSDLLMFIRPLILH